MKGYQVWCNDTHIEDEFDPYEHKITESYPISDVYTDKDEFDKEFEKYKNGNVSAGGFDFHHLEYYMKTIEIK